MLNLKTFPLNLKFDGVPVSTVKAIATIQLDHDQ